MIARVAGWGVRQRMAAAWGVALLLGVCAFDLADLGARVQPKVQPLEELAYYPSGRHLQAATLGHAETAADLAWLRAVQYYGEHRTTDNRFVRMRHVFDILTTMSPHFVPAYVFGAFALAQEGQDFDGAVQLMEKGLDANPTSAELAFQMGFLYYVHPGGRELRQASAYFRQAARLPNPPLQAAHFAAFTRQQSGDLALAWEMWSDVHDHSPNRYLRDMAEREMGKIQQAIATGRKDLAVRRLSTPMVLLK